MAMTAVEYVDNTYAIESSARRLIAKGLKIVSGTLTWSGSSIPGSGGQSFDYSSYGTRYLWMGFNPYPIFTGGVGASGGAAVIVPIYDPVNKKIFLTVCGGVGLPLRLITKNIYPKASGQYVIGFTLFVYEGGASAGAGLG